MDQDIMVKSSTNHSILTNDRMIILLFLLWFFAFYPIYPELINTWLNHSNNSHGMLVPFISLYLIWQRRDQIKETPITSSPLGLLILLASIFIYIVGYMGSVAVFCRAAIVSSLIGIVLYIWGIERFKILRFPLLFLFFMVPVPYAIYSFLALPLQLFASKVSAYIINALSIPVFREGNMLYFSQTQLEVAEACSGLHSMTSFILLSVLFAPMFKKEWFPKIFLILSAIPLALVVNIIRVAGTGILAHLYGSDIATGFLHNFSGLVVFAFGFFLILIECYLLLKWYHLK